MEERKGKRRIEGKGEHARRRIYLDVLRWIFEGQEHVAIPAALRRSLSHLEENYFIFFSFFFRSVSRAFSTYTRGRATTFITILVAEKARSERERRRERGKGRRKRQVYTSLFFSFVSLHPSASRATTRTVTRLGSARRALRRGTARRGATGKSCVRN